jgi:hypothetical protein
MFFISLYAGFALSKTFAALTKQIYSGHFSIVQPTKFKVRYVKMSLLYNRLSLMSISSALAISALEATLGCWIPTSFF